ncbi:MAG: DoxX family protein [Longimonas sp.]|uniref:DoxX family protein n=1 Tax=Longimonas sp. TaxID=2039626 RepID=UPI003976EBDA
MNRIQEWIAWLRDHPDAVIDVVRIYLGFGLFVRGLLFISHAEGVASLVDLSDFSLASAALVHYITFAHLLGGALLAFGLLTRFAALIQIPVLIGAVALVHVQEGLLTAGQSLEFSALVLFLLVVIFAYGAGRWSADYYVFADTEAEEDTVSRPDFLQPERIKERIAERERVATEANVASSAATASQTATRAECDCGYDLNHPRVIAEPRYSLWAGFFFMLGISAPVKEVVFYCQECGTIMKRTKDPTIRRQYRWHTG